MGIDQKVLGFLLKLETNQVISYKKLWEIFSIHPRKVAMIMKKNKRPDIYPCYKVVNESWKVWWYSAYDWIWSKMEKLKNNWIIIKNAKIDRRFFY